MFDLDSIKEILLSIRQNKLRTFLTGFSIAWGIFILIVLLGSGNGLKNGVTSNFKRRAANTLSIFPGITSTPYKGFPVDRQIRFDEKDYNLIKEQIEGVTHLSPNLDRQATVSYNNEYGSWNMRGVYPDAAYINNISVQQGRFINELDIAQKRKVIVISPEMSQILFKEENAIGKYLIADTLAMKVVGIYKNEGGGMSNAPAYIPFSTAQALYSGYYGIDRIDFVMPSLNTIAKSEQFDTLLRTKIANLHNFDPKDRSALYINNTAEDAAQTNLIFNGLNVAIWVIGLLTLVAGVVGIGNIMLITVKERTGEFGIRKAIGASPLSILKMVVLESIMITAIFGYIGMILGIGLMELISSMIDPSTKGTPDNPVMFLNPTVGVGVVLQATLFLVIAGVIAGLIPAVKAVRVSPIEAMRNNN